MSSIFPPSTPAGDNRLEAELEDEGRAITANVHAMGDESILHPELEPELVDALVAGFIHSLLQLGDPEREDVGPERVMDHDPRYLGPAQQPRPREVDVVLVRLRLTAGSPSWLFRWPPGSFPPLSEQVQYDSGHRAVAIKVYDDPRDDPDGSRAKRFLDEQVALIDRLVEATNKALEQWNAEVPEICRLAIRAEREQRQARVRRVEALGIPVRRTPVDPSEHRSTPLYRGAPSLIGSQPTNHPLARAMEWDAFIAHASEDKDSAARPLALRLQERGLVVWFDEFTLHVGDSLRRSIDRGLARSQYGIIILSHNFFAKHWPQKELDGLAAREKLGHKVILPVWHDLTQEEVASYSPTLADLYAANTADGTDHVATTLMAAMTLPRVAGTA